MSNQIMSRDIQAIKDYCEGDKLIDIVPLQVGNHGERYYEIKFPPVTLPTGAISNRSVLMVTENGDVIPTPCN